MPGDCLLVTSTVFPRTSRNVSVVKSVHSGLERLAQTKHTVSSLKALGYDEIHLVDNSETEHQELLRRELPGATVRCFDHHPFDNKGISEIHLMLAAIDALPDDRPVIKISGRYRLSRRLPFDGESHDMAARVYEHGRGWSGTLRTMATRCYAARNRSVLESYLTGVLQVIYAHSARVVGLGSLRRFVANQLHPGASGYDYSDPRLSVEAASLTAIENRGLRFQPLTSIGLSGLAGTFDGLRIED